MPGQLALPVWRDQAKGVPALRAPGFCQPVLFEDDVVDSSLLQKVAGGKTRLSAADHDDGKVPFLRRGSGRLHDGLVVRAHGLSGGLDVKYSNGGVARIKTSPFFNSCQFRCSGTAGETKFCAHSFACRWESFPTAVEKFRDRHLVALPEVLKNDGGGRIALFCRSVGKLDGENDFRHLRRRRQTASQRWKESSRPRI
jgi:hypothetical protein